MDGNKVRKSTWEKDRGLGGRGPLHKMNRRSSDTIQIQPWFHESFAPLDNARDCLDNNGSDGFESQKRRQSAKCFGKFLTESDMCEIEAQRSIWFSFLYSWDISIGLVKKRIHFLKQKITISQKNKFLSESYDRRQVYRKMVKDALLGKEKGMRQHATLSDFCRNKSFKHPQSRKPSHGQKKSSCQIDKNCSNLDGKWDTATGNDRRDPVKHFEKYSDIKLSTSKSSVNVEVERNEIENIRSPDQLDHSQSLPLWFLDLFRNDSVLVLRPNSKDKTDKTATTNDESRSTITICPLPCNGALNDQRNKVYLQVIEKIGMEQEERKTGDGEVATAHSPVQQLKANLCRVRKWKTCIRKNKTIHSCNRQKQYVRNNAMVKEQGREKIDDRSKKTNTSKLGCLTWTHHKGLNTPCPSHLIEEQNRPSWGRKVCRIKSGKVKQADLEKHGDYYFQFDENEIGKERSHSDAMRDRVQSFKTKSNSRGESMRLSSDGINNGTMSYGMSRSRGDRMGNAQTLDFNVNANGDSNELPDKTAMIDQPFQLHKPSMGDDGPNQVAASVGTGCATYVEFANDTVYSAHGDKLESKPENKYLVDTIHLSPRVVDDIELCSLKVHNSGNEETPNNNSQFVSNLKSVGDCSRFDHKCVKNESTASQNIWNEYRDINERFRQAFENFQKLKSDHLKESRDCFKEAPQAGNDKKYHSERTMCPSQKGTEDSHSKYTSGSSNNTSKSTKDLLKFSRIECKSMNTKAMTPHSKTVTAIPRIKVCLNYMKTEEYAKYSRFFSHTIRKFIRQHLKSNDMKLKQNAVDILSSNCNHPRNDSVKPEHVDKDEMKTCVKGSINLKQPVKPFLHEKFDSERTEKKVEAYDQKQEKATLPIVESIALCPVQINCEQCAIVSHETVQGARSLRKQRSSSLVDNIGAPGLRLPSAIILSFLSFGMQLHIDKMSTLLDEDHLTKNPKKTLVDLTHIIQACVDLCERFIGNIDPSSSLGDTVRNDPDLKVDTRLIKSVPDCLSSNPILCDQPLVTEAPFPEKDVITTAIKSKDSDNSSCRRDPPPIEEKPRRSEEMDKAYETSVYYWQCPYHDSNELFPSNTHVTLFLDGLYLQFVRGCVKHYERIAVSIPTMSTEETNKNLSHNPGIEEDQQGNEDESGGLKLYWNSISKFVKNLVGHNAQYQSSLGDRHLSQCQHSGRLSEHPQHRYAGLENVSSSDSNLLSRNQYKIYRNVSSNYSYDSQHKPLASATSNRTSRSQSSQDSRQEIAHFSRDRRRSPTYQNNEQSAQLQNDLSGRASQTYRQSKQSSQIPRDVSRNPSPVYRKSEQSSQIQRDVSRQQSPAYRQSEQSSQIQRDLSRNPSPVYRKSEQSSEIQRILSRQQSPVYRQSEQSSQIQRDLSRNPSSVYRKSEQSSEIQRDLSRQQSPVYRQSEQSSQIQRDVSRNPSSMYRKNEQSSEIQRDLSRPLSPAYQRSEQSSQIQRDVSRNPSSAYQKIKQSSQIQRDISRERSQTYRKGEQSSQIQEDLSRRISPTHQSSMQPIHFQRDPSELSVDHRKYQTQFSNGNARFQKNENHSDGSFSPSINRQSEDLTESLHSPLVNRPFQSQRNVSRGSSPTFRNSERPSEIQRDSFTQSPAQQQAQSQTQFSNDHARLQKNDNRGERSRTSQAFERQSMMRQSVVPGQSSRSGSLYRPSESRPGSTFESRHTSTFEEDMRDSMQLTGSNSRPSGRTSLAQRLGFETSEVLEESSHVSPSIIRHSLHQSVSGLGGETTRDSVKVISRCSEVPSCRYTPRPSATYKRTSEYQVSRRTSMSPEPNIRPSDGYPRGSLMNRQSQLLSDPNYIENESRHRASSVGRISEQVLESRRTTGFEYERHQSLSPQSIRSSEHHGRPSTRQSSSTHRGILKTTTITDRPSSWRDEYVRLSLASPPFLRSSQSIRRSSLLSSPPRSLDITRRSSSRGSTSRNVYFSKNTPDSAEGIEHKHYAVSILDTSFKPSNIRLSSSSNRQYRTSIMPFDGPELDYTQSRSMNVYDRQSTSAPESWGSPEFSQMNKTNSSSNPNLLTLPAAQSKSETHKYKRDILDQLSDAISTSKRMYEKEFSLVRKCYTKECNNLRDNAKLLETEIASMPSKKLEISNNPQKYYAKNDIFPRSSRSVMSTLGGHPFRHTLSQGKPGLVQNNVDSTKTAQQTPSPRQVSGRGKVTFGEYAGLRTGFNQMSNCINLGNGSFPSDGKEVDRIIQYNVRPSQLQTQYGKGFVRNSTVIVKAGTDKKSSILGETGRRSSVPWKRTVRRSTIQEKINRQTQTSPVDGWCKLVAYGGKTNKGHSDIRADRVQQRSNMVYRDGRPQQSSIYREEPQQPSTTNRDKTISSMHGDDKRKTSTMYGNDKREMATVYEDKTRQKSSMYGDDKRKTSIVYGNDKREMTTVYEDKTRQKSSMYGDDKRKTSAMSGDEKREMARMYGDKTRQKSPMHGDDKRKTSTMYGNDKREMATVHGDKTRHKSTAPGTGTRQIMYESVAGQTPYTHWNRTSQAYTNTDDKTRQQPTGYVNKTKQNSLIYTERTQHEPSMYVNNTQQTFNNYKGVEERSPSGYERKEWKNDIAYGARSSPKSATVQSDHGQMSTAFGRSSNPISVIRYTNQGSSSNGSIQAGSEFPQSQSASPRGTKRSVIQAIYGMNNSSSDSDKPNIQVSDEAENPRHWNIKQQQPRKEYAPSLWGPKSQENNVKYDVRFRDDNSNALKYHGSGCDGTVFVKCAPDSACAICHFGEEEEEQVKEVVITNSEPTDELSDACRQRHHPMHRTKTRVRSSMTGTNENADVGLDVSTNVNFWTSEWAMGGIGQTKTFLSSIESNKAPPKHQPINDGNEMAKDGIQDTSLKTNLGGNHAGNLRSVQDPPPSYYDELYNHSSQSTASFDNRGLTKTARKDGNNRKDVNAISPSRPWTYEDTLSRGAHANQTAWEGKGCHFGIRDIYFPSSTSSKVSDGSSLENARNQHHSSQYLTFNKTPVDLSAQSSAYHIAEIPFNDVHTDSMKTSRAYSTRCYQSIGPSPTAENDVSVQESTFTKLSNVKSRFEFEENGDLEKSTAHSYTHRIMPRNDKNDSPDPAGSLRNRNKNSERSRGNVIKVHEFGSCSLDGFGNVKDDVRKPKNFSLGINYTKNNAGCRLLVTSMDERKSLGSVGARIDRQSSESEIVEKSVDVNDMGTRLIETQLSSNRSREETDPTENNSRTDFKMLQKVNDATKDEIVDPAGKWKSDLKQKNQSKNPRPKRSNNYYNSLKSIAIARKTARHNPGITSPIHSSYNLSGTAKIVEFSESKVVVEGIHFTKMAGGRPPPFGVAMSSCFGKRKPEISALPFRLVLVKKPNTDTGPDSPCRLHGVYYRQLANQPQYVRMCLLQDPPDSQSDA